MAQHVSIRRAMRHATERQTPRARPRHTTSPLTELICLSVFLSVLRLFTELICLSVCLFVLRL
jgi:uncharacterized membrane protein